MKQAILLSITFSVLLIGCTSVNQQPSQSQSIVEKGAPREDFHDPSGNSNLPVSKLLQNLGPAPELNNTMWLNVDQPMKLKELRGKVILLEMWTFGCYNCRNTIPYLRKWHDRYGEEGLIIIANHFPEFSHERDLENLKTAVMDLEIKYAVAQDNEGETWRAYRNRYWPTLYLIDKKGNIRFSHIGEGRYEDTEKVIQALLAETMSTE